MTAGRGAPAPLGMPAPADIPGAIAAALHPVGLILRGGFHPDPADAVPPLADGRPVRSLLLVGNAGAGFWRAFTASAPDLDGKHPLDDWSARVIGAVATAHGAHPVFPNQGPPYPPFQRWALRADAVHPSPIGLLVHPDYGLWHAYRAALLFAEDLALPAADDRPSPCDDCAERPCLSRCPVAAFTVDGFAAERCAEHVAADAGADCREAGCLARRACPVGRRYGYAPAQAAFHMGKFVAAVRGRARPDA